VRWANAPFPRRNSWQVRTVSSLLVFSLTFR
jgi:hypothetical protein